MINKKFYFPELFLANSKKNLKNKFDILLIN